MPDSPSGAIRRSHVVAGLAVALLLLVAAFEAWAASGPTGMRNSYHAFPEAAATAAVALAWLAWSTWTIAIRTALARTGARGFSEPGSAAALSWAVPLLNLFVPCRATQQTWRAATRDAGPDGRGWRAGRGSPLVIAWWALTVAGTLDRLVAVVDLAAHGVRGPWSRPILSLHVFSIARLETVRHVPLCVAAVAAAVIIARAQWALRGRAARARPDAPPTGGGRGATWAGAAWLAVVSALAVLFPDSFCPGWNHVLKEFVLPWWFAFEGRPVLVFAALAVLGAAAGLKGTIEPGTPPRHRATAAAGMLAAVAAAVYGVRGYLEVLADLARHG